MSRTGQHGDPPVVVATFPMPPGTVFDWHTHEDHQLAWAPSGVLTVRTADRTWVLPPSRALWIPAGLPHETGAESRATMRSLYIRPGHFDLAPQPNQTQPNQTQPQQTQPQQTQPQQTQPQPTPVAATPLLAELIGYLSDTALASQAREHAETLLADLLTPTPVTTIDVRWPAEKPARGVAEALRRDPADQRTLREWGRDAGASERTLARAFVTGTGTPFGRWRTLLRLQAALPMLAVGQPVTRVARRVGYETPSAFVAAFRRETGTTPAAYFRP